MATYKEIYGSTIEVVTSDPENPVTGQIWYNSTDNVVKGAAVTTAGAWATGADLNTGRTNIAGCGVSNTASIAVGGRIPPSSQQAVVESYDGTSWTEVGDLNTARNYIGVFGSSTAAIGAGGATTVYQSVVESWNGSSWSEVADINSARGYMPGAGTQTSGLIMGGEPDTLDTLVESWNGSSWTEVGDLNTGVRQSARGGQVDNNSAIKAGGYTGTAATANAEEWNGTSWAEVSDLNTARYSLNGDGATSTASLAFGGYTTADVAITEEWNGTSWTEIADMSTARNALGGSGSTSSALAFGGAPSLATTEEWTGAGAPLTVTFTDS